MKKQSKSSKFVVTNLDRLQMFKSALRDTSHIVKATCETNKKKQLNKTKCRNSNHKDSEFLHFC